MAHDQRETVRALRHHGVEIITDGPPDQRGCRRAVDIAGIFHACSCRVRRKLYPRLEISAIGNPIHQRPAAVNGSGVVDSTSSDLIGTASSVTAESCALRS